jgi:hypothetical protein
MNTQGTSSGDLQTFFSLQLSPFLWSVWWILATLFSLGSQLPLNSRSCFSLPVPWPGYPFKANCVHLSGLTVFCCLMSHILKSVSYRPGICRCLAVSSRQVSYVPVTLAWLAVGALCGFLLLSSAISSQFFLCKHLIMAFLRGCEEMVQEQYKGPLRVSHTGLVPLALCCWPLAQV